MSDDTKDNGENGRDVHERYQTLAQLEEWLETPMLVLGVLWLALLVLELTRGLSPVLETAGTVIWVIFIVDFALRLTLAPDRSRYLKHNWLTALSLLLPALRVLRAFRALAVFRAARAARGLRLVKVVGSLNRGMRTLGRSMGRRGVGYVASLTLIVVFAGAAGMYAFESGGPAGQGIEGYGAALWWTTMLMTTIASEYWPVTPEGRALCVLLSLYAVAVFGYITAALATFFVERDAADPATELASAASVEALRGEIRALTEQLRQMAEPPGQAGNRLGRE